MKQALDGFLKYFSPAKREVSLLSPQAQPTPPLSWMPSPVTESKEKNKSPVDSKSEPDEGYWLIGVPSAHLLRV